MSVVRPTKLWNLELGEVECRQENRTVNVCRGDENA